MRGLPRIMSYPQEMRDPDLIAENVGEAQMAFTTRTIRTDTVATNVIEDKALALNTGKNTTSKELATTTITVHNTWTVITIDEDITRGLETITT